jgi:carbohydrate-selective porin OprB
MYLLPGLVVTPDLQYIRQPGGLNQPSDIVVGMKAVFKL